MTSMSAAEWPFGLKCLPAIEYSISLKNHIRLSGYILVISVIGLTQSMPFHILDSVLYLTNIKNENEWV